LDEEQEVMYQKLFEDVKKNIEVNTEWRRSHLEIFKNWLDDLEEKTTTESTTDSTTDSTDGEESTTDSTTDSTDGAESTSDSTTDSTDGAESTSDSTTDSTDGAEYFQISLFTIFAYLLIHIAL
jgi:lysyl-tRNA synthetase class I